MAFNPQSIEIGGAWKSIAGRLISIGNAWKSIVGGYIQVGGVWKSLSGGTGFQIQINVAAGASFTLPLVNTRTEGSLSYNCTVDWGDGSAQSTVTAYNDANRIHTYANAGSYTVEIRGVCEGWSFNNAGDVLKVTGVIQWGDTNIFAGFKYLYGGFYGCSNLTSWGSGAIPASGTGILSQGFHRTFNTIRSTSYALLPSIANHPNAQDFSDLGVSTALTFPSGWLDNASAMTSFQEALYNASITSVGPNFLRAAVNCTNFITSFYGCTKFQISADIFYAAGEQATRFLNKTVNFANCFYRSSFTGSQGTAPDLWNCDFGETITLDVAPVTDWVGGDTITGQSSGATATVVSKVSTYVYKIKQHFGTFSLDEIVGVTGNSNKLADQGATKPTFAGKPTSTGCFGGAGNSATSLTNYSSIPTDWGHS